MSIATHPLWDHASPRPGHVRGPREARLRRPGEARPWLLRGGAQGGWGAGGAAAGRLHRAAGSGLAQESMGGKVMGKAMGKAMVMNYGETIGKAYWGDLMGKPKKIW